MITGGYRMESAPHNDICRARIRMADGFVGAPAAFLPNKESLGDGKGSCAYTMLAGSRNVHITEAIPLPGTTDAVRSLELELWPPVPSDAGDKWRIRHNEALVKTPASEEDGSFARLAIS
jgi:hypothetical protein